MAFAEPYYKQYVLLKEIGENSLNAPIEEFKVCSHHMTIARWAFAELCMAYSDRPLRMRVSNVTFEDIPQALPPTSTTSGSSVLSRIRAVCI